VGGLGGNEKNSLSNYYQVCIPLISIEKSSSDGAEQMLMIPERDGNGWKLYLHRDVNCGN
jgi:hypothetical protein